MKYIVGVSGKFYRVLHLVGCLGDYYITTKEESATLGGGVLVIIT